MRTFKHHLCIIVTDAISFNVLYEDQLEYLLNNAVQLTLICGGSNEEIFKLRERCVGKVVNLGFVRKTSILIDALVLLRLIWHFIWNRYPTVIYTTPKALLLGSIASFFTRQERRVAYFQGRVYENFAGPLRKIFIILDTLVVRLSHEILFVSQSLLDEFKRDFKEIETKGVVLGSGSINGVNLKKFSQIPANSQKLEKLRSELNIRNSDFLIIIVGRINRDKGIKQVEEVIYSVQQRQTKIRFLFVGNAEDQESKTIMKKLILLNNVMHVSFSKEVHLYMALAQIHLFLSLREGFGNVAIEAASFGIPTLAYNVVGVRDSVVDNVTGRKFEYKKTSAVTEYIFRIYQGEQQFNKQASRSWVINNFSQEYVWKNFIKFLTVKNKK